MRMRFSKVCRRHTLGFGLVTLMAVGLTIHLLGIHFPKKSQQISALHFASPVSPSSSRTCHPKRHIMFLKTHKTAGSTILNVLHRYGDRNGLIFALPFKYQFNYPTLFHSRKVKGFNSPDRPQYDVLCHHMRFNLPEVRKVMQADAFYFTIFRDPATMAESAFSYYRSVSSAFKKAPNFKAFISHPSYFFRQGETSNHYARNLLWFDLGFNPDTPFSERMARAGSRAVEATFNLVLFAEHFDESLILLKEELCWELDDVVTFKLNSRGSSTPLEPEEVARLRSWNAFDWYLYSYFNSIFWEKVERFGRAKMNHEIRRLRKRRKQLAELCLEDLDPVSAEEIKDVAIKPFQLGHVKILGWTVRKDLEPNTRLHCVQMVTPELQYKDLLDARQFPAGAPNVSLSPTRAIG